MQTGTNIDQRRRRGLQLAALLVVVAAVVVAVGLRLVGPAEDQPAAPVAGGDDRPLPEQLADEVVTLLEGASLAEHAAHGHHFDEDAHGIVCAADTLGFEPTTASTVDEVETIYAHHMCAEYGPGLYWPDALRASGPLVVELDTAPASIMLPEQALVGEEGVTHADRVRSILPEEYHEQVIAADGFDPDVAEVLRDRFESIS
ncbi:hypothetical protein JQS43_09130 [Natronosporangium hydrolyticum]|uniref:Uncharacterized protein n=1 Tax=Natronosporangium hydrolyticum TaxID=2811111 RepID=A0A895YQM2_9ACTN|nr:hypothetical protein [Natronosporangium hydrolyticum]QSB16420.1 hypothetical protein JQS43_09130 [Natronosporangium hydrolyticum]